MKQDELHRDAMVNRTAKDLAPRCDHLEASLGKHSSLDGLNVSGSHSLTARS